MVDVKKKCCITLIIGERFVLKTKILKIQKKFRYINIFIGTPIQLIKNTLRNLRGAIILLIQTNF